MLLINGWLKLASGHFDKVAAEAAAMVQATRAEAGCIEYAFARDIDDPDLIRIAERWESETALAAHSASAHMARFQQAMASVTIEAADLWLYTADAVKKLR